MSNQLQLPYEVIEKVAGRDAIRKNENIKRGGRESWKIPFELILERQGFNTRYEYSGIEELADSILTSGLLEPLWVDVLEDGRIFLERGHRRYRAIELIRKNNWIRVMSKGRHDDFALVECFINNTSEISEEQRIVNIYASNMHSKRLKPLEQAENARRLKYCLGKEKSSEEVGKLLGVSRQTVDNMLLIVSQPDSIKSEIKSGNMKFTDALTFIRNGRREQKQADRKEEESHQTSMQTPEPKDSLKDEMEELKNAELDAERYEQRIKEIERKEAERLERDAVLVEVTKEKLESHIGKRLAAPAKRYWKDSLADTNTGEIIEVDASEHIMNQGVIISDQTIEDLINARVKEVYIFKEIKTSASVISEPVAQPDKKRFDESRPEIKQIQNAITLGDKIENRLDKCDIPEGTKKDLFDFLKWQRNDLIELREWVHTNKKQNKRGS